MTNEERQRRHDEHWQKEVLDGMGRTLAVLHDLSDHLHQLAINSTGPTTEPPTAAEQPVLYSVKTLAELLGIPTNTIRNLQAAGHAPTITRLGNRLYFHRDDVTHWLSTNRSNLERTQPWSGAFLPGRIGADHPRSSQPAKRIYCSGSNTEPLAASRYAGRAVCRVCKDDVLVNRDGLLRKHYPTFWR